MKITKQVCLVAVIWMFLLSSGCTDSDSSTHKKAGDPPKVPSVQPATAVPRPTLPSGIHWETNDHDPVFASPLAVKGGTFHTALLSFPRTFRLVGPDSNGSFAGPLRANNLSLINIHPNTGHIIPELATHWAFDPDKKTMYFKLNPLARWSDNVPVTAADYVYTLEFMRSPHIIAPFYNDYYTREIESVVVYDDYTIAVKSTKAMPELYLRLGISPTPRHFFGTLDDTFVEGFNWRIIPNTGPYQISEFKKGKRVRFERKKQWWAKDLRYFKNRFNLDAVVFNVIRDYNMIWEYFKKGEIDVFDLTMPKYWYDRADTRVFNRGYAKKIWFFNDTPVSAMGMWLNQDKEIFADPRVRMAFAHAMNVDKVIKEVLRGDYYRLAQAFMGYGEYTNNDIRPRAFNIDKVESLMTEAGWQRGPDGIWQKQGRRFSIEVTYGFDEHTPRLVVLKEEALKAGVELVLQKLDSTAAFKKFLEKKHEVAWMGWSTNLRPSYWQGWHSDNAHKTQTNNITNTDDPELDRLIDQYRSSLSETERKSLSRTIQQKIHDQAAFVPTFMVPYVRQGFWRWLQLPESHGTRVSGSLFDPFDSTYGGLFWFDKTLYDTTRAAMKDGRSFEPETIMDRTFKPEALN
ncbi:DppE [Desulforapulum autotrophicum HRM2]|uniref:DppE n=1 Tax=Desulforapulum autotrophicum (strain ATCC 43914 / DSM 3382 / VKM B-1955 / HRM2) TaxID=177437 RepID=C0QJD6_DESAH|nr:extracellular solute-binding protein [Desulforapulum autotrophicum]ACN15949.1 DppE [Desulforapulum autotrophicum HRM2]